MKKTKIKKWVLVSNDNIENVLVLETTNDPSIIRVGMVGEGYVRCVLYVYLTKRELLKSVIDSCTITKKGLV